MLLRIVIVLTPLLTTTTREFLASLLVAVDGLVLIWFFFLGSGEGEVVAVGGGV